jgi:Xaa-Pro aminopeptidase
MKNVELAIVPEPPVFTDVPPVFLNEETINKRKQSLLEKMTAEKFDCIVIYADKEHGSNFEYLTGFIPRFEEGILVLDQSGLATLILGNENLKLQKHSRIEADLIHYPQFSLPNQPMTGEKSLATIFKSLDFSKRKKVGIVGWKLFTTQQENPAELFDVPYFIVDAIKRSVATDCLVTNAAHLLIGEKGSRTYNNANEVAHYEYGANLSSRCILSAMNELAVGKKEAEIGACLTAEGQLPSVVPIAATGKRFEYAQLSPTHKRIKLGDPFSMTVGYKGGLSSRAGFVVDDASQLPSEQQDYLEKVAKPYYFAIATWLEEIHIGMKGQELYQVIEQVLPKSEYHWHLNPGHLVSDEEWMSSPIYSTSNVELESGMMFQVDIIPSVPGYAGVSAEECIMLADQSLQLELQRDYPELWQRVTKRKAYVEEVLNIKLSSDVLLLSNTVAYLRPFYLAKDKALRIKK